jgi:iron complex outermembrane receptor protein
MLFHRFLAVPIAVCSLWASPAIRAAEQGSAETLPPITVTGTRIERSLPDTPAGVSVIDETSLRDGRQGLQLDEALSRVPGLFLQNRYNFAQGQRLSLRGFGSRAAFGVRGIRIRVDGFPETLPDGQSQIDSVDLDNAVRAEVLRGPSSVLYGNAGGGVVSVDTASGLDRPGTSVRLQAGGDGFRKAAVRSGGRVGDFDYHAGISHLESEGYRDQSEVRKTLFNTRLGWALTPAQRLEAVLTVLDLPLAQDPGGLSQQQLAANRRQAVPAAVNLDAGQEVAQRRLGLSHSLGLSGGGELRSRVFYSQRDFEQVLPFFFPGAQNLVAFDRDFFGLGSEYRDQFVIAGMAARYIVGAEAQRQNDDRTRRGINPAGERSAVTQRQDEAATVMAGFGQLDVALLPRLTASLGARVDRLRLSTTDRLLDDGDDSGARRFTETSYSGGLVWQLMGEHRLYANVATAFESPSFTEFARPDGGAGFNPDIRPQESLNREIGLRNGFDAQWHYELTLFSVRVDDEITPFESEGRTFFQNAARTKRDGVEATLIWRPLPPLTLTGSYSYARLRFDRFVDTEGNDLSGNELPGIPRGNGFLEAAWRVSERGFAALDAQFVDSRYAENANQLRVAGHTLVNARAGMEQRFGDVRVEFFGGVNNLLDRDYIANLRVNANPANPIDQRGFFEPAPARHFYLGLAFQL